MSMPYATAYELNILEKQLTEKIKEAAINGVDTNPTKLSELQNDVGYITNSALAAYARKVEIPTRVSQLQNDSKFITNAALNDYAKTSDLSSFATKTEVNAIVANIPSIDGLATEVQLNEVKNSIPTDYVTTSTIANYALKSDIPTDFVNHEELKNYPTKEEMDLAIAGADESELISIVGDSLQVGKEDKDLNLKTRKEIRVNSNERVVTATPWNDNGTIRESVLLKNNDQITGQKTDGNNVPLVFMSKWDKVEVGGSGAPLNLNGNEERPTYNDDDELALVKDIPSLDGLVTEKVLTATIEETVAAVDKKIEIATSDLVHNTELVDYAKVEDIPDISGLATEAQLNAVAANIPTDYIPNSQLNILATKEEVETKQDKIVEISGTFGTDGTGEKK